jgi:hypothetical protein
MTFLAAIVTPIFAAIVIAVADMTFLIARCVFLAIPVVLNEINALATRAVTMAIPAPIPGMAGVRANRVAAGRMERAGS